MTIQEMLFTLGYATWWALGGWLFGIGVEAMFMVEAATVCALSNVIVGLLLLLPVIADSRRRKLFFKGARGDEPSDIGIGLLWVFPFVGLCWGLLWWLMGWFT